MCKIMLTYELREQMVYHYSLLVIHDFCREASVALNQINPIVFECVLCIQRLCIRKMLSTNRIRSNDRSLSSFRWHLVSCILNHNKWMNECVYNLDVQYHFATKNWFSFFPPCLFFSITSRGSCAPYQPKTVHWF